MSVLPVQPAAALAVRPEEHRWLVESLWADEAVGIVGGEPKSCKSFLALDLAVAVASGVPCLRRYAVPRPGRVLFYAAEDALDVVRRRFEGICRAAGVELAELDVQVITAPALRLDQKDDRERLAETVAALRPRLLVLDPFVRLHRIDENVSGEVAPLLALPARAAASSPAGRRRRPPRAQGRRTSASRSGAARLLRVSRLGRLQPLPAPRRRAPHAHRRTARRRPDRRHHTRPRGPRRRARAARDRPAGRARRTHEGALSPRTGSSKPSPRRSSHSPWPRSGALAASAPRRSARSSPTSSARAESGVQLPAISRPPGSLSPSPFPGDPYALRETETGNPSGSLNARPSKTVLTLTVPVGIGVTARHPEGHAVEGLAQPILVAAKSRTVLKTWPTSS